MLFNHKLLYHLLIIFPEFLLFAPENHHVLELLFKLFTSVMKRIVYLIIMSVIAVITIGQENYTQVIRGKVIDADTKNALPGANVVVRNSDPLIGTTTDADGYFFLEDVPVGRAALEVSFVGYHTKVLDNLFISAAKEMVLEVPLRGKAILMEEIEIRAEADKKEPVNKMASASARMFTVEESQRFAGARNDVARMASNYAGVATPNDAENGIVIRGNSPNGLLWMLEGVEIPNPNHFGTAGASGGPVGMLNNNVLANSDFMTGAFPAEYGNALSGVFDLQMRNGNHHTHEFTGQVGFNGVEIGAEGPLSRETNASYLANYRYSTLSVLKKLGMNFGTGTAIPYYQDLNYNVNIPMRNKGTLTIYGVSGKNHIDFINSDDDEGEDFYGSDDFDVHNQNVMTTNGIKYNLALGKNASLETSYNFAAVRQNSTIDSVTIEGDVFEDFVRNNIRNIYHTFKTELTYKLNTNLMMRSGGSARLLRYDLSNDVWQSDEQKYYQTLFADGSTLAYKAYAHWRYHLANHLTLNGGLHINGLSYTGATSVEPRLGMQYDIASGHALSVAYGRHSKMLPIQFYMQQTETEEGGYNRTNAHLNPARADHFVVGYDWAIRPYLRLKTEAYYQSLFDVPVERSPSYFSVLNLRSMTFFVPDSLVNEGSGRNYGVELTFEKFMHNGSYFLLTTSLFDAQYTGSDGIQRSAAFDSDYVVNLLGGKEWRLTGKNASRMMWITADLRCTTAGGKRYTPVDVEASLEDDETRYDTDRVFGMQYDPYFRADVRVAFKMETSRISQEWTVDVQNVTNHQNPFYQRYNLNTRQTETVYQLGMMPIMQYKIYF